MIARSWWSLLILIKRSIEFIKSKWIVKSPLKPSIKFAPLIINKKPELGIIFAPAKKRLFYTYGNGSSFELINNKEKAIFIGIHQSNWEILVPTIDKFGIHLVGIYRHINNPYINKFILQIRKKSLYSNKSIYTPKGKTSAKDIIDGIINNNSIILLKLIL